jgi:hypothetical protein
LHSASSSTALFPRFALKFTSIRIVNVHFTTLTSSYRIFRPTFTSASRFFVFNAASGPHRSSPRPLASTVVARVAGNLERTHVEREQKGSTLRLFSFDNNHLDNATAVNGIVS